MKPDRRRKLTLEQVDWIRRIRKTGKSIRAIAAVFGVSHHTIYAIIQGRSWKV